MADLGPGTMPRGKYPESPAPAGSHALISRTPTPGGMLHANLGLPRPPPRNFQPPLPRFPSRLSPRRMSGTTVGRILSHPLPWSSPRPRNRPQSQRQQHPPIVIPEFSFRASGRKMSGISAARRGLSPELRPRCREATARGGRRGRSSGGILSHPLPWRRGRGWGCVSVGFFQKIPNFNAKKS